MHHARVPAAHMWRNVLMTFSGPGYRWVQVAGHRLGVVERAACPGGSAMS